MSVRHILRHHSFLRGLNEHQFNQLMPLTAEVTFEQDEIILMDGQRSEFLYLIVEGSVAVELHTPLIAVCVQALEGQEAFGWSALLNDQDTVFRVRARERTEVLRLDGAGLAHAFEADPELAVEFLRRTLKVVAGRVKATEVKFAEMCGVRVVLPGVFASGGMEM